MSVDPNETLRMLREASRDILNGGEEWDGHDVAEMFEALDGWITRGGFLPREWAREV